MYLTVTKYPSEMPVGTVIKPCYWSEDSASYSLWKEQVQSAETCYFALIKAGATPEQARSILPNSLKTEIIVTMNLREWLPLPH